MLLRKEYLWEVLITKTTQRSCRMGQEKQANKGSYKLVSGESPADPYKKRRNS